MIPLEPRVRDQLEAVGDEGWKAIILRLTQYAVLRARRLRWRTPNGTLPGGKQPEDLAMDAIAKLWHGGRTWDPAARPDLLEFLKGIVDSLLSHLVRSAEHVKRTPAPVAASEQPDVLVSVPDPGSSPEDALVEAEDLGEAQTRAAQVREAVRGETELELVLLGIEHGKRPMEIASDLGISREEVYQHIRKIKRWVHADAPTRVARKREP